MPGILSLHYYMCARGTALQKSYSCLSMLRVKYDRHIIIMQYLTNRACNALFSICTNPNQNVSGVFYAHVYPSYMKAFVPPASRWIHCQSIKMYMQYFLVRMEQVQMAAYTYHIVLSRYLFRELQQTNREPNADPVNRLRGCQQTILFQDQTTSAPT